VFEIGSTLTTASASSVRLINGASPCNVYWQVGSSATLGTTTVFAGNVMANASIALNNAATVQGRLFASNGAVTLNNNVVDRSMCATSATSTPGSTVPGSRGTGAGGTGAGGQGPNGSTNPGRKGSARLTHSRPSPLTPCNDGFTATVRGSKIKRVVFSLDDRLLASRFGSPFRVHVPAAFAGSGHLKARVTFKDATRARTLTLRYRACAAAVVRPRPAPSTFTG
jgi:hypothetical protein